MHPYKVYNILFLFVPIKSTYKKERFSLNTHIGVGFVDW